MDCPKLVDSWDSVDTCTEMYDLNITHNVSDDNIDFRGNFTDVDAK